MFQNPRTFAKQHYFERRAGHGRGRITVRRAIAGPLRDMYQGLYQGILISVDYMSTWLLLSCSQRRRSQDQFVIV